MKTAPKAPGRPKPTPKATATATVKLVPRSCIQNATPTITTKTTVINHAVINVTKPTPKTPKTKAKFYAVANGRQRGIYTSWPVTQAHVHGFSGALFKGFSDLSLAQDYLRACPSPSCIAAPPSPSPNPNGNQIVNLYMNVTPDRSTTTTTTTATTSSDSDSETETSPPDAIAEVLNDTDDLIETDALDDIDEFPDSIADPAEPTTCFHILVQVVHTQHIPADLTEQTLQEIFTTTFATHTQRIPDHLLLFKIGSITYRNTKRRAKPNSSQRAFYYYLVLVPSQTEDQFDPELFHDQCLTFVLQNWHLHKNVQFDSACCLRTPEYLNPPSPNPWARQIHLLLPACNNLTDAARGCLLGIPPDQYGHSRRSANDILHLLFDHVKNHLPDTDFGHSLLDWHTFSEYYGIRPALLTHGTKKARVFFFCSYSTSAWNTLLVAARTAGPAHIHGCLAQICAFPSFAKKADIIQKTNAQWQDFRDLHSVATDRLLLTDSYDEENLLSLTPNLVAIAPHYADHLPEPTYHTLFFEPDPTTLSITPQTIHKANIPGKLLAPLPTVTHHPTARKLAATIPTPPVIDNNDNLDAIFSQWSRPTAELQVPTADPEGPLHSHMDFQPANPKRKRPPAVETPLAGRSTSNVDSDASDCSLYAPPLLPRQKNAYASPNYFESLATQPSGEDDSETVNTSTTHKTDDDIQKENDDMSEDEDDDDDDDDLSYDLEHYEAALSQDAFLHHRQLESFIAKTLPTKQNEFRQLRHRAITNHEDPALLETHIKSWQPPHP
jgi:hypothetical protein